MNQKRYASAIEIRRRISTLVQSIVASKRKKKGPKKGWKQAQPQDMSRGAETQTSNLTMTSIKVSCFWFPLFQSISPSIFFLLFFFQV